MLQLVEKCQNVGDWEKSCMISEFLTGDDKIKEEELEFYFLKFCVGVHLSRSNLLLKSHLC